MFHAHTATQTQEKKFYFCFFFFTYFNLIMFHICVITNVYKGVLATLIHNCYISHKVYFKTRNIQPFQKGAIDLYIFKYLLNHPRNDFYMRVLLKK